jgi:hypothetical protein
MTWLLQTVLQQTWECRRLYCMLAYIPEGVRPGAVQQDHMEFHL